MGGGKRALTRGPRRTSSAEDLSVWQYYSIGDPELHYYLHASTSVPLAAKVLIAPWGCEVVLVDVLVFHVHFVGAQGV